MPHDEPVPVRGFVEERGAKRDRGRPEESARESNQARIEGDLLDGRVAHQMPCASTAPLQSVLLESSGGSCDVVLIQDCRENLEAAGDVVWRCDQGCTRLVIEGRSRHRLFTVYRCLAAPRRRDKARDRKTSDYRLKPVIEDFRDRPLDEINPASDAARNLMPRLPTIPERTSTRQRFRQREAVARGPLR